jgi:hypothetical protein
VKAAETSFWVRMSVFGGCGMETEYYKPPRRLALPHPFSKKSTTA